MTGKTPDPGAERLGVLAALVEFDANRSDLADFWTHADGRPYADDETALITSATLAEWELAGALRGAPDQPPGPAAPAVASLLRIADGTEAGSLLLLGLREVFLDGKPDDPDAEFAGVYRRLALPVLGGETREQALAVLEGMGR